MIIPENATQAETMALEALDAIRKATHEKPTLWLCETEIKLIIRSMNIHEKENNNR